MKALFESNVSGAYNSGKAVHFSPWVAAKGPTNRRNVIAGLMLRASLQIDIATATLQGENLARLFKSIIITDIAGQRWNLTGEASRAFISTMLLGPQRFHEEADLSTGNDQTLEYALYIPFAKPWLHRGWDFAMPADIFRELQVTFPTQDDLDLGSTAATIDSLTYEAIAVTREEDTIEFKMRDVVTETAMQTATQGILQVPGAYVAEILAYRSGDALQSMSNWTEHTVSRNIQPEVRTADDWKHLYRLFRQVGDHGVTPGDELYNDPVVNDVARVVWMTPDVLGDTKLQDMPFVNGQLKIQTDNSDTDVQLIHRYVEPKSETVVSEVANKWGVTPASARAKTANKTRRSPSDWGNKFQFITTSAVAA